MNISKLLYKTTGLMTKKYIASTAEKIGTDLISTGMSKTQIEIADVRKIIQSRIGKKHSSRILISDKFEDFKNFTMTNLNFSEIQAQKFFKGVFAAAIPGGMKTKNSFFKLDVSKVESLAILVNTITHECEHLMYQQFGIITSLTKRFTGVGTKRGASTDISPISGALNEKILKFQNCLISISGLKPPVVGGFTRFEKGESGMLKQLNMSSTEEFHDKVSSILRKEILKPAGNQDNIPILFGLLHIIPDEARAYAVGGRVERKLFHPNNRLTRSEMLSQIYSEAVKVVKTELLNEFKAMQGKYTPNKPANKVKTLPYLN